MKKNGWNIMLGVDWFGKERPSLLHVHILLVMWACIYVCVYICILIKKGSVQAEGILQKSLTCQ